MWRRGSGSSALDRADVLLSAKRRGRGDAAAEAAQRPAHTAAAFNGLRPQSSLGGGSRFVKKDLPSAANNSGQSPPVSKSQRQQISEPRLAQIESSVHNRKKVQEEARPRFSPPPETPGVPVSVQSSSDQSVNGKRFLKNKAAARATDSVNAAAASGSPKGRGVGVRSLSRASGVALSLAGLEMKSTRVVSGVSLESDVEDMRELLGDSWESTDKSLLNPGKSASADKILNKGNQKVHAAPPQCAERPLTPPSAAPATPCSGSPTSLSCRSSPFRYTGQVQAQFSPSVLSPTRLSPSPPRRGNSARRLASPQRSLSSMSGHSEVRSLDELFPVVLGFEDPKSEISSVLSEDFKINVMSLDDLAPAASGPTEDTPKQEREAKQNSPSPGSLSRRQQSPRLMEKREEEQKPEKEDVLDYQSDFESLSGSRTNPSASQVSEHLQGDGDELEETPEDREALKSDVSLERTEDGDLSAFSDTSPGRSQTSKSSSVNRDSRSSASHIRRSSSNQSRRRAPARKVLKEVAVQTQPETLSHVWPTAGVAALEPPTYMNPTPMAAYTLSGETLEDLSNFNPAAFVVNEMLKQQLAMTRRFIDSSRHLYSSLVQSLEPPSYRYTTLEGTMEYIRKHRSSKNYNGRSLRVQQESESSN